MVFERFSASILTTGLHSVFWSRKRSERMPKKTSHTIKLVPFLLHGRWCAAGWIVVVEYVLQRACVSAIVRSGSWKHTPYPDWSLKEILTLLNESGQFVVVVFFFFHIHCFDHLHNTAINRFRGSWNWNVDLPLLLNVYDHFWIKEEWLLKCY